jgi:DNA polymerase V
VHLVPSDRFEPLLETAKVAFRQAYIPKIAVSGMHITATELRWPGFRQPGLFEMPAPKAEALAKVKREVNARFGRFTLRSGATLPLSDVYRDESASYDICDVHGKMCF